ncbi:MAG: histidine kinase N-terminal 7TM domain-containing protein [Chloroflexota bacterium]
MMLQFSPYLVLIGFSAVISIFLAWFFWQRRPAPGIGSFVTMMLALSCWSIASALQLAVTTLAGKAFFINLVLINVMIATASWFLFTLSYTGRDGWVTQKSVLGLTIFPVLTTIAMLTNDYHNLFWTSTSLTASDGLITHIFESGILFYVHTAYQYALIVAGQFILLRSVIRSPQLYRGQIGLLVIGALFPLIGNIIFLFIGTPLPDYFDPTPTIFLVTGICIGLAYYRFRLMDIVPVAREIIVENMVDGVIVVDREVRIVDINKAALKILGKEGKNVLGQPLLNVWEKQREALMQFRGVEQAETEVNLIVNNEPRTYQVRLSPLRDRHGNLTGRIGTLTDITTLKQIQHKLEDARQKADEATRLKSDFLATMSHELRTPLNAVIGYSELMTSGMVGDLSEQHWEYTDRIASNAKSLLELINDILDISKIEAGRMELKLRPMHLSTWMNELVVQNQVLADNKNLTFTIEIDHHLPETLIGDADRLRQIAVNLLSNAFKFTNEGTVTFQILKHDSQLWSIIVTDTGIGIPPHKQETIFNEFQQADTSSTREHSGTGLGLAIVRKLVLMMGGHIRLQSELDKGSTFTVLLPLITDVPKTENLVVGVTS